MESILSIPPAGRALLIVRVTTMGCSSSAESLHRAARLEARANAQELQQPGRDVETGGAFPAPVHTQHEDAETTALLQVETQQEPSQLDVGPAEEDGTQLIPSTGCPAGGTVDELGALGEPAEAHARMSECFHLLQTWEEAKEVGWGPDLAKQAFHKGFRVSTCLLISAVGYAAVLGAFWAAYVELLDPPRTALAIVTSYICTNLAMLSFLFVQARRSGSRETEQQEAIAASILFAFTTAAAYIFGSLLLLAMLLGLRHGIDVGRELGTALDVIIQTRGRTAWQTYLTVLSHSCFASAIVTLSYMTTKSVMATVVIQVLDMPKWHDAELWVQWELALEPLINKHVLFLSWYLPTVLIISSISAVVSEGITIILLFLCLCCIELIVRSARYANFVGPDYRFLNLVDKVLGPCSAMTVLVLGIPACYFNFPPLAVIPAGLMVNDVLAWIIEFREYFPTERDPQVVTIIIESFLFLVLLVGGSAALKYDLIRILQVMHVEMPTLNTTASNSTFPLVLQGTPELWPRHQSHRLSDAVKAARTSFFIVLLIVESLLAFCLLFFFLKLTPASRNGVPGLSAEALNRISVTASILLLLLCLRLDLTSLLQGSESPTGLAWEAWLTPYTLGLGWELVQAATVPFTRSGTSWGFLSVLLAFLSGAAPWLSDGFDVAKDTQFSVMALADERVSVKAIGLVSVSFLVLYSLYTTTNPEVAAELPTSYLALHATVVPPAPKPVEDSKDTEDQDAGDQPGCSCSCQSISCSCKCRCCSCQEVCSAALQEHWPKVQLLGYKQTRPSKVQGVVVEDLVQTGLSIGYLGLTGNLRSAVPVLNVALPLAKMAFAWKAHRPLLPRVQVRLVEEALFAFRMGSHDFARELAMEACSGPPMHKVCRKDLKAAFEKAWPEFLDCADFDRDSCPWFIAVWAAAALQLTTLDLTGNGKSMGNAGGQALAAAMPYSPLKRLLLGYNNIGPGGIQALAPALPRSQLTELVLPVNIISHAGAETLAAVLPLSKLQGLDLGQNNICSAGAKALATALPHSQLTKLDLHFNRLGDAGAEALSVAIPNSQLKELILSDNSIGDAGAESLAAAIPHSQITELYLVSNSISDTGAQALAIAVRSSRLLTLDVRKNEITEIGKRALHDAKEAAPGSSLRNLRV